MVKGDTQEEITLWKKVIWCVVILTTFLVMLALVWASIPHLRYCLWVIRYQLYFKLHKILKKVGIDRLARKLEEGIDRLARKLEEQNDKQVICIENRCGKKDLYYLDSVYDQITRTVVWGRRKRNVKRIWVLNGPTGDLSRAFISFFECNKPVIFIGRLFHYTQGDRLGLQNLLNRGFELEPWNDKSNEVYPHYGNCLRHYFRQLKGELGLPSNQQNDYQGREDEVADIACGEIGVTHLLTNEGRIYRSNRYDHAEVVFTEECRTQPCNITRICIKNSPCAKCSEALINFFCNTDDKPEIRIGSIYKFNDTSNFDWMVKLCLAGFELTFWKEYTQKRYGPRLNPKAIEYLERVKSKAAQRRRRH